MVTIKDIANKIGVSISTVSKGLNGASDISAETRQLVLDAALEMGYVGKHSKSMPARNVCIVMMHLGYSNINEYGYELISGFRLAATENNLLVSVISVDDLLQAHPNYDKAMEILGYQGAFFVGITQDDEYIEQLRTTQVPTIVFEEYIHNPHVGTIGTNCAEAIEQCVHHLYDLGHRKIAFINGSNNCLATTTRMDGYVHALRDLGLPYNEALIGKVLYYPPDGVNQYISVFLDEGATAIVCGNDYIAAAAASELTQRGKRVPNDVSITGFDDNPIARYLSPPLTTVCEDRVGIGRTALILLDSLTHNSSTGLMQTHPKLLIRKSTGKAPR